MSKQQNAPQGGKLPDVGEARVAIVAAEWNGDITDLLVEGAETVLKQNGFKPAQWDVWHVPGAIELTYAASQLIESSQYDAVIVFGCVVRGETPHFDYVCQSVTQGVTQLNADVDVPVIFGVLTVNDRQQALDRCGGSDGHKGCEAAEAAIKMIDFTRRVKDL